jgi:cell division protein FtsN
MSRYFEIIITGRQLAALVAGVALLIAVAFGLGVAVRWQEPAAPRSHEIIAGAPAVTLPPAAPAPAAVATVAPTPEPSPTAAPTATPVPPAADAAKAKARAATPVAAVATREAGRWVQVAAFGRREQADGVRNRVVALGFAPRQAVVQSAGGGKFRVRVGPFPDGESAGRVAARLRAEGFGGAFVVRPGE